MALFQNKYRIESTRLPGWDYGAPGTYYVTTCTKNREHFFGEITGQKMHLSELGKKVEEEWLKTPIIRPDMNLTLGRYVVMPNQFHMFMFSAQAKACFFYLSYGIPNDHLSWVCGSSWGFHGLITIGLNRYNTPALQIPGTLPADTQNTFGPKRKNLGSIMAGFKSSITTYARIHGMVFDWQARYWDHVIRNDRELYNIEHYIDHNVENWDRFNK